MSENVNVARVFRKQSLHANVIRACGKCGAPGYWHNIPDVNVGCFAPEKVTQLGMDPVGEVCPQCGTDRDPVEPHGEVWSKVWRTSLWTLIRGAFADLLKPLQWRKQ